MTIQESISKTNGNLEGMSIFDRFNHLQIKVASPSRIMDWSFGEVIKPETINYRTLKPEKDGLFCERIFGPTKDWECYCGKYKRVRHKGIVCERCGVEVTESKVRRHRMGHLKLAAPVCHIWFLKGIPSYMSLLTDIPLRDLEQVIYFNQYIVLNPGSVETIVKHQLLSEEEYELLASDENAQFEVAIGAEAVRLILEEIAKPVYEFPDAKTREERGELKSLSGLEELTSNLRLELTSTAGSQQRRAKIIKRLRLLENLITSKTDPTWMVLDVLPITPPDLRPMVQLDGGRFATSDLNDLYRRAINRNNRLARLLDMGAPEIIVRNEKRMLQEAVDALIDNGRRGRVVTGSNGRPLKSLSNIIEGKQGRFRQNLLGKRVDYSGRSVIVVGPQLGIHQCGLPREMAIELFKPFVISKLIERQICQNIKSAKKQIEKGTPIVWEILEEVIQGHPVLLNRAPTLHRLGIQAFEPVLVEGRAIQLHPLVCAAFNADFDGDQMAVHVPLSVEAQAEARMLMMASNNILLPASGKPTITPTQDMVLGIYYLTAEKKSSLNPKLCQGAGMYFYNFQDAVSGYEAGILDLHAKIYVRGDDGEKINTTVGRVVFNMAIANVFESNQVIKMIVPTSRTKEKMKYINENIDKKKLSRLVLEIYEKYGSAIASEIANSLKNLGFRFATKAGVTIGIEDLTIPEEKKVLVTEAEKQIEEAHKKFERGDITEVERYNKVIDTWSETTEKLTEKVIDNFDRLNPVYMMAFSGARGNISQVRQLVGMRGLMADSQGQIIDLPIKTNFKEGLNVTEYIISSYGARKGLVDTALKTADSGYLTRRLVDVAQDVVVREYDCGTKKGIFVHALYEGEKLTVDIADRVIGRVATEDLTINRKIIIKRNEIIDREKARLIEENNIKSFRVRSPLVCELPYGICQMCYGWSLTTNTMVDIGEAIGIIAAQSIGEPGTQLTMRTFHTGGVVAGATKKIQIRVPETDTVKYDIPTRSVRTRYGDPVLQTIRDGKIKVGKMEFFLPGGSQISFESGTKVQKDEVIAEYTEIRQKELIEKATKDIIADHPGQILFEEFSADERRDRQGNISRTANKSGIIWVMEGDVYNLPPGSRLTVKDGEQVKQNNILAETYIISERGGEVRYKEDLTVVEEAKFSKEKIKRLVQGREVSIVIARVGAENAKLESTKQGNSWKIKETKTTPEEFYTIKVVPDETIENKSVIAELVDDGVLAVSNAGEIRYDGLEVDESRIITQPGNIYFIPEEVHYLSKDVSLKLVENEEKVKAGQEIVKDVFTHIDGVVEIKIDNDIIHEVVVRNGDIYDISDATQLKCEDGEIVKEGVEVYPGITTDSVKLVTLLEDEEKATVRLLLRPVQSFSIEPKKVNFQGYSTDPNIALLAVTQMLYRDGERVRNFNGGPLSKTSLVLTMTGDLITLKGKVELTKTYEGKQELQIILQENVVLRREQDTNITQLLVDDHDHIEPGVALAKTQVLARINGEVCLSTQQEKRILLITSNDLIKQETTARPVVKVGEFIKIGDKLGGQTESVCSGQIVSLDQKAVVIRKGRPYLVSAGAQLQCDNGHLVQRGDQLASLIYERIKTADIVQGLPRVEELLEGRKPRESTILSELSAKVKVVQEDDTKKVILVAGDVQKEIQVPTGLNIIVEEGQEVKVGESLTDGPANPHDILNLLGVEAVQQYLLDEVQKVYRSQGVEISDKHIEIIIRQMTRKVRIEDAGDTILLPGELVELRDIKEETEKARKLISKDAKPPIYKPILLGITKASLNTESFISAASFQETTRILSEASIQGKKDWLRGLKENVIIGRLIPAGTGYLHSQAVELNITDFGQAISETLAESRREASLN
ncbi:MAG: DNA-directed RNA polymerase subunit beta' [Candidatus Melainabacteria bacterium]|nr:DNA-directed RNA polymerase subunit beta' [Candidatus Melainabacteria bacterium]